MDNRQRIAKTLSRAGIASRREAELLVINGSVSLNGFIIKDPATKVTASDKITVHGKPVLKPEKSRLWRYHKPIGLVTTNSDEKGRETIYDKLPTNLPRLMSIGRLDITSEGLLLLTNDGVLKRHLEMPSTGLRRKYRVRAHGIHREHLLERLRAGIFIDDEHFKPMEISLDRISGSNIWYIVILKEGRNREIRRAFDQINLKVNRLIRISFGVFELGLLAKGEIQEIPTDLLLKNLKNITKEGM